VTAGDRAAHRQGKSWFIAGQFALVGGVFDWLLS